METLRLISVIVIAGVTTFSALLTQVFAWIVAALVGAFVLGYVLGGRARHVRDRREEVLPA